VLGGRLTDEATEKIITSLLGKDYHDPLSMTNIQRREILDLLLSFYIDHMGNFGEVRSVQVLRDVLM
jgi:DNA repair protein RecO (recombination protein O)